MLPIKTDETINIVPTKVIENGESNIILKNQKANVDPNNRTKCC